MKVLFLSTATGWPQHAFPWIGVSDHFRKRGFAVAHLLNDAFRCTYWNTVEEPRRRNDRSRRAQFLHELIRLGIPAHLLATYATRARGSAAEWVQANRRVPRRERALGAWNIWDVVKGSVCREARRLIEDPDSDAPALYDAYAHDVVAAFHALDMCLDSLRPDTIVVFNGLFYLERAAVEVARKKCIATFAHENSSLADRKFLDPAGVIANRHSFGREWRDTGRSLDESERDRLARYLEDLFRGCGGVILQASPADAAALRREWRIPEGARVGLLLAQTPYDTTIVYDSLAFPSMPDFIEAAIRRFGREELAILVVRFHPLEAISDNDRTWRTFASKALPDNVRLVHAQECNTYSLMRIADFGIASTSQSALEMAAMHKPVVIVGDAFYAGKGFTHDAPTPERFNDEVGRLLAAPSMPDEARRRVDVFLNDYIFDYLIPYDPARGAFDDAAMDKMAARVEGKCAKGGAGDFPPGCAGAADYLAAGCEEDRDAVAAMLWEMQGRLGEARETWRARLVEAPDDPLAIQEMASICAALGDAGEAARWRAMLRQEAAPLSVGRWSLAPLRLESLPPVDLLLATAPQAIVESAWRERAPNPRAILAKAAMPLPFADSATILRYDAGSVTPRLLEDSGLASALHALRPRSCLIVLANDDAAGYGHVMDFAAALGAQRVFARTVSGGVYEAAPG